MKKLGLLFVFVFAVSAMAQDKPAQEKIDKSQQIQVTLTSISLEQYGPMKEDQTFKDGDKIYINLELKGLKANDQNQATIQADISIPQLQLNKKNIIDNSTMAEEVVPMYVMIPIGEVQKAGLCNVTITIRDIIAKTTTDFNTTFKLSDEITTFYCKTLTKSQKYSLDKITKEMPGIQKHLKENNFVKDNEVIIKYTNIAKKILFVIVPIGSSDNYSVITEQMKSSAQIGCGISFELFKSRFLFNFKGIKCFRAITE